MEDDRKEPDESIVEGTLNDLLPGMGSVVKKLRKRSPELNRKIEEKDAEIKKRLEEGYSPEPKIQYGVRVRTLARDGAKNKEEKPEKVTIEPVTDLFDEGDYLRIIAELPGLSEEKIRITLEKTTLTISASEKGRHYRKKILLPCDAILDKKRYQNGILELTLEKTDA
jgi:HSP20 family molecular chaperone IbpA